MSRLDGRIDMDQSEPDSGHPTPREDDHSEEYDNENFHGSTAPLTSTPIAHRARNISVRSFFEDSEKDELGKVGADQSNAILQSLKQLIRTTQKNHRLTKEKESLLNESATWCEEKSVLREKIRECDAVIVSLRNELQQRDNKIVALESRISELLQSISEHSAEEASEAAVELFHHRKESGVQCETVCHSIGIQSEGNAEDITWLRDRLITLEVENKELCHKLDNVESVVNQVTELRKEENRLQEKCSFLENENTMIRKKEEELVKEIEEKNAESKKLKSETEALNNELSQLRAEVKASEDLLEKKRELLENQMESDKQIEELRLQNTDLRACIASHEQTIKALRENEKDTQKKIDEKFAEAKKLGDECRKLRDMGENLTEESVYATLIISELKQKLAGAYSEIDALKNSLAKEEEARRIEAESAYGSTSVNRKLQDANVRIEELRSSNEKMSTELEFLRKQAANSASKQEMEHLAASLADCQQELATAKCEKKALMEKAEHYQRDLAMVQSLRFELKTRDDVIAGLRAAEEKHRSDLSAKSEEQLKLQSQFDVISRECSRIREEFHNYQENAEQQYLNVLERKDQQIEAMRSRLVQLESYPGQTISLDTVACPKCSGQMASSSGNSASACILYDCIPALIRDVIEKIDSNDMINAIKEMQSTHVSKHFPKPALTSQTSNQDAATSTSFSEEADGERKPSPLSATLSDSLPLSEIATCCENMEDYRLHGDSPDLRPELRRFLAHIKYEQDVGAVKNSARNFLESCDRLFLGNSKEVFRKELQNIHEWKEAFERTISSERKQWDIERENMHLQLDRCRRQLELAKMHKDEKNRIIAELNAARIQVEQYRLKLWQKCEEVERLEAERDEYSKAAKGFHEIYEESQQELSQANDTITGLENSLKDTSAALERERREVISLKDDKDAYALQISNLQSRISELAKEANELCECCEKLKRTEKYNQKTIKIVCESFWEREGYLEHLKKESAERRKFIERSNKEMGAFIADCGGSLDPINEIHATVMSWASADAQIEKDQEAKKQSLLCQLEKLNADQAFLLAKQHVQLHVK